MSRALPSRILALPVTTVVCVLAAVVSLAWFGGKPVDRLFMDGHAIHGEPWRFFTSALPHVNVVHLLFNLWWLWELGDALEEWLGHAWFLLLVLLLAGTSAAGEFAVLDGGVGLSGVVYGLFALAYVAQDQHPPLARMASPNNTWLMVGWFFFCILTTVMNVWSVANVAHGMGALMGAAVGWCLVARSSRRALAVVVTLLLAGACIPASTVWRPWINFSSMGGSWEAALAYNHLVRKQADLAIPLLERSVQYRHTDARWWFNLGVAYQWADRNPEALDCYRRALRLEEDHQDAVTALLPLLHVQALESVEGGDLEKARKAADEMVAWDPRSIAGWALLHHIHLRLGNSAEATRALDTWMGLQPQLHAADAGTAEAPANP